MLPPKIARWVSRFLFVGSALLFVGAVALLTGLWHKQPPNGLVFGLEWLVFSGGSLVFGFLWRSEASAHEHC